MKEDTFALARDERATETVSSWKCTGSPAKFNFGGSCLSWHQIGTSKLNISSNHAHSEYAEISKVTAKKPFTSSKTRKKSSESRAEHDNCRASFVNLTDAVYLLQLSVHTQNMDVFNDLTGTVSKWAVNQSKRLCRGHLVA